MKHIAGCVVCVGVVVCFSHDASAHHSFAAVFDGNRTVDVAGVVREFRLVNPHAEMILEVEDAAGETDVWTVEFDGLLNLTTAHWTPDTIKAGERVTVHGNPARSDDGRIWFLSLTRADGSELRRPALDRVDAIEAQRRQRALERTQSE